MSSSPSSSVAMMNSLRAGQRTDVIRYDSGVTAPANFSAELSGGIACSSALVVWRLDPEHSPHRSQKLLRLGFTDCFVRQMYERCKSIRDCCCSLPGASVSVLVDIDCSVGPLCTESPDDDIEALAACIWSEVSTAYLVIAHIAALAKAALHCFTEPASAKLMPVENALLSSPGETLTSIFLPAASP